MNRINLLIIGFILAGQLHAQQGFYIKPVFIQKKCHTNWDPDGFSFISPLNKTFEINHRQLFVTRGFDVGILFGYNFKRSSIEVGILNDEAELSFDTKGYSLKQPDSIYMMTAYRDDGGSGFFRFPLRYYYQLNQRSNFLKWGEKYSLDTWVFGGIDILYPPSGGRNALITSSGNAFYQGNGHYINEEEDYYQTDFRYSFMLTAGICFKLYKGPYNILNLDIYGGYNHASMSRCVMNIRDNNKVMYQYILNSTGSGIYFTITREFNLKTCLDYRREKMLKRYQEHESSLGEIHSQSIF